MQMQIAISPQLLAAVRAALPANLSTLNETPSPLDLNGVTEPGSILALVVAIKRPPQALQAIPVDQLGLTEHQLRALGQKQLWVVTTT